MLPVNPQHTNFGKEVDSNPNSIIKPSLLLHLQWFRHPCQHKVWTLCLGFVDHKRFPVLQQFIPKVWQYYNLGDKVIKSSREGMDGKNDIWDITSVWPECTFICHTPTSRGGTASATVWEQLLCWNGLQQLEPLQNLQKHNELPLETMLGVKTFGICGSGLFIDLSNSQSKCNFQTDHLPSGRF